MANTVYPLDYTVTDSVNNRNMNIGPNVPGVGMPRIVIPVNTRARWVIQPSTRAQAAIASGSDPKTIGLQVIPNTPNQFGQPIIQNEPLGGTYTYEQLAKGVTRSAMGSAIEGSAVALCIYASIFTYQSGDFELVDLPGQLIVGGNLQGKPGYKRGRFSD